MKKNIKKILHCLLHLCALPLLNLPAYSENIIIENHIYIDNSIPDYIIENENIRMMKEIGRRQWEQQNETYIKNDYTQEALEFLKNKKYEDVIKISYKGLECAMSEALIPKYYHYIGLAYLKKQDYIRTIINYNIAINKHGGNNEASIFYERGLARYKIDDYEGAIEDYDKAVSLELDLNSRILNGDKIYNYKEEIASKNAYEKGISIKPAEYFIMPILANYGRLAFIGETITKGKYEKIYDFYTKQMNKKQEKSEIYNNRGVYFLQNKNYADAIKDFQKSLEINPRQGEAYFNLALTYYSLEEYKKAKNYLDKYSQIVQNKKDNFIVFNYGTSKINDNKGCNSFVFQILTANIELKLNNAQNAQTIYDTYKVSDFTEISWDSKLPVEYLPLLEGGAYQLMETGKYKQARKFLNNLLTADYNNYSNVTTTRGKYTYYVNRQDFDINQKYHAKENAYIFANMALMEKCLNKENSSLEYITIAKDIAFKFNEIDLYQKIIKIYNIIKLW